MIERYSVAGIALCSLMVAAAGCGHYEKAFTPTARGSTEIKELPPATLLVASSEGSYGDRSGDLFQKLFRYIKKNDIKMTVPVEGGPQRARMAFYAGSAASGRELSPGKGVTVVQRPPQTVASIGRRGSYKGDHLAEAETALRAWLQKQEQWQPAGEPYAVFWDAPFVPPFLRRYEIHIPVSPATGGTNDP